MIALGLRVKAGCGALTVAFCGKHVLAQYQTLSSICGSSRYITKKKATGD